MKKQKEISNKQFVNHDLKKIVKIKKVLGKSINMLNVKKIFKIAWPKELEIR